MQKYIITSRGPIIFPDSYNHSDFKDIGPNNVMESAGAFAGAVDKDGVLRVAAVGGLMTLGLHTKPTDSEKLERMLNNLRA